MREIIQRVQRLLDKSGYDYCNQSGCVDIAAKKKGNLLLLKVLSNVDSVQEEQTKSMKILSDYIDANTVIVGEKTRKEGLDKNIMYRRFEMPTVSLGTLENILSNEMPIVTRVRGGYFVEIDSKLLKNKRKEKGLTQKELAEKIGSTKKNIYQHEKENKKATEDIAKKLESILGPLAVPIAIEVIKNAGESMPRNVFEKNVLSHFKSTGFQSNVVYNSPFNIIARDEKTVILSEAEENERKLKKTIEGMINFSRLSEKPVIAVTRNEMELDIPNITEKELKNCSAKEIRKKARRL